VVVYGEEKKFFTTDFTDDTDWKNCWILEVILNLRASMSVCGFILLAVVSSYGSYYFPFIWGRPCIKYPYQNQGPPPFFDVLRSRDSRLPRCGLDAAREKGGGRRFIGHRGGSNTYGPIMTEFKVLYF